MKNMKLCAILIFAFITLTNAQWIDTTIAVGDGPCALVYNPINNKVYCANNLSDDVTVIDGATNAVITTIAVGNYPVVFTWNSDQNRTYVANWESDNVSVIRDVPGIEEDNFAPVERDIFTTTLFSGPLQLPEGKKCKVFDITGRVVTPDKIQPGIYFIEIDGVVTQKVVKVK